jgi:hypothetical protein
MLKVREAMASSGKNPMDGDVHVDEFVLGGREIGKTGRSYDSKKKKAVTAIQLTKKGKVKRMYAMKIDDFQPDHCTIFLSIILAEKRRSQQINGEDIDPFQKLMT